MMIVMISMILITAMPDDNYDMIITRWGWCQWTSIYGSDGPSQVG